MISLLLDLAKTSKIIAIFGYMKKLEKIKKIKNQRNEKEEKKCEENFHHEQYLLNC
jgi:hypothetical protein